MSEHEMNQVIFSIVVPVYDMELYIEKCIKSLLSQNFDAYEILLVNDGSTDSSLKICDKYANANEKIKLFNKENGGLSDARNYGMREARGKYVLFIDSDDYIENNILRVLYDEICEKNYPDVVLYNYYLVEETGRSARRSYVTATDELMKADEVVLSELKCRNLPVAACFGAYKRELVIENSLYFVKGILHEDERWSPQILLKADEIYKSPTIFYNYVKHENSITTKRDKTQNGIDLMETCEVLDKLTEADCNSEIRLWFKNRIAMLYMKAVSMGKLYRVKKISRTLPFKYSCTSKDKVKSIIFMISARLYCWFDKIF